MEHNFRWLKTRLNLDTLESRMQPGSLFTSGLDLGAVADMVARPETTSTHQIKKLDDSQDIQIVGASSDNHIVQTENVAAPKAAENHNTTSAPLGNNTPARASVNPVVQRPAGNKVQSMTVGQYMDSRNLEMKSAPLQAAATHRPTMAFPGGQISVHKAENVTLREVDCGSHGGSRVLDGTLPAFTYNDFGGTVAREFGNAGGRGGANLGTQYLAGTVDGDGIVVRIASDGTCSAVAIDAGADVVEMNDVHATPSGVVAVGDIGSTDEAGVFVRLDPTTITTALSGPFTYSGAGLDVSLDTTGVRLLSSNQEIFLSGGLLDKGSGIEFTFNAKWDRLLTAEAAPQVNYTYLDIGTGTTPVNCSTEGVDADRLANSYLAISCDETGAGGGWTNVFARLNSAHSSTADLLYGVTLWDGNAFTAMPDQGNLGGRLLGGTAAASGMRTVGAFELSVTNPGFLASLNVKWTDLSNPAGPAFTGAFWYVLGADFYGEDVTIQRPVGAAPAQEYVATPIGVAGDHGGFVIEYDDGFAAFVTGYGFDTIGTDEIAYGVDSRSGAGNSDIFLAGTNDGDLGAGLNCDTTYNGGLDGWGATFGNSL